MDLESLQKILQAELDFTIDQIQDPSSPPRDVVSGLPDLDYRPNLKGKAMGLAMAISHITGKNVDEIREEAWVLWLARQ